MGEITFPACTDCGWNHDPAALCPPPKRAYREGLDAALISYDDSGQMLYAGVPMATPRPKTAQQLLDQLRGLCIRMRICEIDTLELFEVMRYLEMPVETVDAFIAAMGTTMREKAGAGTLRAVPDVETGENRWCPDCQKYKLCNINDECPDCGAMT